MAQQANWLKRRKTMPEVFMDNAWHMANERSQCEKLTVGCYIVTKDWRRVVGMGYNGGPAGSKEYTCSYKDCHCTHAEINAMVNASGVGPNMAMVVTTFPCLACSQVLVNSGIKTLYYRDEYKQGSKHWKFHKWILVMFEKAGIETIKLEKKQDDKEAEDAAHPDRGVRQDGQDDPGQLP